MVSTAKGAQHSAALPDELKAGFPGVVQAVRLERRVTNRTTGEVRVEESFALTSLCVTEKDLYGVWRGHWGIEREQPARCCLVSKKRDEVFKEDRCRTRLAAQSLAALRNTILSLLHLSGESVLGAVRRFACQTGLILDFLGLRP